MVKLCPNRKQQKQKLISQVRRMTVLAYVNVKRSPLNGILSPNSTRLSRHTHWTLENRLDHNGMGCASISTADDSCVSRVISTLLLVLLFEEIMNFLPRFLASR
jgi:hypothetical protein